MDRLFITYLTIILLQITSCTQKPATEIETFIPNKISTKSTEISEIIYSMYLPTDMAFIFDHTGSNYNPEIPASIDNYTIYAEDEQIAVMLGIYGVDMMYMKLLGQLPQAASYFQVINNMATKISSSETVFSDALKKIETHLANEDSAYYVIEAAYKEINSLYTQSNKENLTSLSLMGGWIETMYIGLEIMHNNDLNDMMAKRILQQKYSLNSIYTMLQNNQESLYTRGCLLLLKKLKAAFDEVEIKYNKEGFAIDTSQKKIQSTASFLTYNEETLNNISNMIIHIRNEIININ